MHAESANQIKHASSYSTLHEPALLLDEKDFKSLCDISAVDLYIPRGTEPSNTEPCPPAFESEATTRTEPNPGSPSANHAGQVSSVIAEPTTTQSNENDPRIVTLSDSVDESASHDSSSAQLETTCAPAMSKTDSDDAQTPQIDNSGHVGTSDEGCSDEASPARQPSAELNDSLSSSSSSSTYSQANEAESQSASDDTDSEDILLRTRRRCRRESQDELLSCDEHSYSEGESGRSHAEPHAVEDRVDSSLLVTEKSHSDSDDSASTAEKGGEEATEEGEHAKETPKALDADQDKRNPAYVPREGKFFMHDCRGDVETPVGQPEAKQRSDARRWKHDMFSYNQQVPRCAKELMNRYGYDIRNRAPEDDVESKGDSTAVQEEGSRERGFSSTDSFTDAHNVGHASTQQRQVRKSTGDYSAADTRNFVINSRPYRSLNNGLHRGRFSRTNPQVGEPRQEEYGGHQHVRSSRPSGPPRKPSHKFTENPRRGQYHQAEASNTSSERNARTHRRSMGENRQQFDSEGQADAACYPHLDQSFAPAYSNDISRSGTGQYGQESLYPEPNLTSPTDPAASVRRQNEAYTRWGGQSYESAKAPSKRYSTLRQNKSDRDSQHTNASQQYNSYNRHTVREQAYECHQEGNYSADYPQPDAYHHQYANQYSYPDGNAQLQSLDSAGHYGPPSSRDGPRRYCNVRNTYSAGRPLGRNVSESNAPPFQRTNEQTEQYYDAAQDQMYATGKEPRPILGHHSERSLGARPSGGGSARGPYRSSRLSAADCRYTNDQSPYTSAH